MPDPNPPDQTVEKDDHEENVRVVLGAILRRRWVVAGFTLFSIAMAVVYLKRTIPIYTATTLILIEKEGQASPTDIAVSESKQLDYYQTQYQLITSRTAMKEVSKDLDLASIDQFAGPSGIDELLSCVSVQPINRSRLVNILARSPDPELAAAVFVVKFSGVNAGLARQARQKLLDAGISIAGAVVNQVTWRGKSYGDYYYHYQYYSRYSQKKPG